MSYHEPVLCQKAIDNLLTDPTGIYVDGTAGGGGHAEEICRRLGPRGTLVCCDADADAISHTRARLIDYAEVVSFVHGNFGRLATELEKLGITAVNGVLLDLGVSSYQIDTAEKGFSFQSDGQLDMRFDRRQGLTARDVVNTYTDAALERIIREYGEERYSRKITAAILARRPLSTSGDLGAAISSVVGGRFLTKSLARVFQALRIEVNAELANLSRALLDSVAKLRPGGRLVVIAYHSLEDRIVKSFLKRESARVIRSPHAYIPDEERQPALQVLHRKPLVPDKEEIQRNPRARSAKMRVAERLQVSGDR